MVPRIISLMAWLAVASLLGLAACAPKQVGVVSVNNQGTQVASSSTVDHSTQPGISEPGAGQAAGEVGEPGGAEESGPTPSGTQVIYTDAMYKFSTPYPSNFVIKTLSTEQLSTLTPKPEAVFLIMNPTTASSQVPDEPGDLEIYIFSTAGATSLDSWLTSVRLVTKSSSSKPFTTAHISGLKVCGASMVFPQCKYYVFNNGRVYQLITFTQEGESMFNSFSFLP